MTNFHFYFNIYILQGVILLKEYESKIPNEFIKNLCEEFRKNNYIDPEIYNKYPIKRGLRNSDGTGVVAGCTLVCNVHGYLLNEGERMPVDGELIYRGINIKDIVRGCEEEDRFGFEETSYLLLFGKLPTEDELRNFQAMLAENRELPGDFAEDMIMKAPSRDIMNKMARSVLALYSYDEQPETVSLENTLRQSIELIARFPTIAVSAYQVKKRHYDKESMYLHFPKDTLSTAENILHTMRSDTKFTHEEAKLLDLCLMLHAEHGGGNNSTFATRVLTSSGTDIYSSISAAIGSLKGPKHGGANIKVDEMFRYIKAGVSDWTNDDEIESFLEKIIRKQEGDGSGLIYGMGHAVYTKSDPRAVILKEKARGLAEKSNMIDEFNLIEKVEKLTPDVFAKVKNDSKTMCANVDMYSGFVYRMLGIPYELFTPMFAIARIPGWCAHRLEELVNGNRIIRPAYKAISEPNDYRPLKDRL